MDLGHWIYPTEFDPEDWAGFIYRILDTKTGMEYIGKKQFRGRRSKKVKNRKNKKWRTIDSNWKSYTSSSKTINEIIEIEGKDRFKFFIESLHKSKASLSYAEVVKMITENVLREKLSDGTKKYYNGMIPPVKFLPPEETIDEEANRLFDIIINHFPNQKFKYNSAEDYDRLLHISLSGENNPMYGRCGELSPRYKSHPFENLAEEELANAKEKMSHKGKENGMYGRHPFENLTEDELAKVKEKMRHTGKDNGMYGKPCYYKMTEEEKQQWKDNIGKGSKGKIVSEESKKKMSESMTGVKKKKSTCPHCSFTGGGGNMLRYHFDNCKAKQ